MRRLTSERLEITFMQKCPNCGHHFRPLSRSDLPSKSALADGLRRRLSNGMRRADIAREARIGITVISGLLSGKRNPQFNSLRRLAEWLDANAIKTP